MLFRDAQTSDEAVKKSQELKERDKQERTQNRYMSYYHASNS